MASNKVREAAVPRVATSWTVPLQYSVAGWFALQAFWSATLPFWVSDQVTQMFVQAVQRQRQLNPEVSPPPADYVTIMNTMFSGVFWIAGAVGIVISLVVVIGALGRWTWIYYAVLVLLGFWILSLPYNRVSEFILRTAYPFPVNQPSWVNLVSAAFAIPSAALFVWMLIALAKRGPWAMVRGQAGEGEPS
jgi:hypothetical protein